MKNEKNFLRELFCDENSINEKSVIGFLAFLMMVVTLIVDILTGFNGKEMPINEFVYDGFLIMALGAFGIASVDKFINAKHGKKDNDQINEENQTSE